MKITILISLLSLSAIGHTLDCQNLQVQSLLPSGAEAKSVKCVASFHSGKDQSGPVLNLESLAWPVGMQEQACEELNTSLSDPNAKLEYCIETAQESVAQ